MENNLITKRVYMDIKLEDIQKFSKQYNSNKANKIIENAIINNGLKKLVSIKTL